ncbi:hypothetical protein HPP92_025102, partial [Vanilla planifolia]
MIRKNWVLQVGGSGPVAKTMVRKAGEWAAGLGEGDGTDVSRKRLKLAAFQELGWLLLEWYAEVRQRGWRDGFGDAAGLRSGRWWQVNSAAMEVSRKFSVGVFASMVRNTLAERGT